MVNLPLNADQLLFATTQRNALDKFARSAQYFRQLANHDALPEVLIHIKSTLYADAIISWCAVFGNYNNDKHHWKNTIKKIDLDRFDYAEFREENILKAGRINSEQWKSYHYNIIQLRNKALAHLDDPVQIKKLQLITPNLDIAILAGAAYHDWLFSLWNRARAIEPLYAHAPNNFIEPFSDCLNRHASVAKCYFE